MNIFALNMTFSRDFELAELMMTTLVKYGIPYIQQIRSIDTAKYNLYLNGSGWGPSMIKLNEVRNMLKDYEIGDNDFILSVDSDVVFTGDALFNIISPEYGIIGTQHKPPYTTHYGPWGHLSGALIFIRGDIAKMMCSISEHELNRIRVEEFKRYVIVENEDVVLSYLAMVCGAKVMDLPGNLSSGNFEEEVLNGGLKSYYHLNYCPTTFLGENVTGKWGIAKVLKDKGIEL